MGFFDVVLISVALISSIHGAATGGAPRAPKKMEPKSEVRLSCSNGVRFMWDKVEGATSYIIEISTCHDAKGKLDCENPNDNPSAFAPADRVYPLEIRTTGTSYETPLDADQEYWWRMWAKRGSVSGRKSGWSNFHCD